MDNRLDAMRDRPPLQSREVSVVLQGPVLTATSPFAPQGITQQALYCARMALPEAQIILSTWQGSPELRTLDCSPADAVVTSKDPGAERFYSRDARPPNPWNNGNRLIVSSQRGLEYANRPYVLKLRSDMALYDRNVLDWMHRFAWFDPAWRATHSRILAYPVYSLLFERQAGMRCARPFHVSDWCQFGRQEDINALFSCPLMDEPGTSQWFARHPRKHRTLWPDRMWRWSPEQYIAADFARRALGFYLEDGDASDQETILASRRFIANNFVILDQHEWAAWSLKLLDVQYGVSGLAFDGLYSHTLWRREYDELVLQRQPEPAPAPPADPHRLGPVNVREVVKMLAREPLESRGLGEILRERFNAENSRRAG